MKKILSTILLSTIVYSSAQTQLVFVFFKDKPNKAAFYANPLSELTQKSIDRRANLGIPLNDQDAPLEATYVQNIQNLGYTVSDKSKWLNGVAVNATTAQIAQLQTLSYVQSVESFVKNPNGGKRADKIDKFEKFNNSLNSKIDFVYGQADQQTTQINLKPLHQAGYTGNGITIAMLDTGYPSVNTGSAYARLRNAGKIKGGYNFISKNNDLYNTSFNTHGSVCLGAIAGFIQNQFVGTAPDAEFYLYVTEHGTEEVPEEELYWIQAAEDADRKGVDVISASLGYANFFDDTRYNYTYADMNGTKSFVARGAQIASEKGIIVMVANGNEGSDAWHYLITPADNSKVFSVGAVTSSGDPSSFTSYGPNSAGALKPDASARGSAAATVFNSSVTTVSGTSIATPIAAGGVASLLQALPKTMSRETIKNKLRNNASLAPSHNAQIGYGILNFAKALNDAQLGATENIKSNSLKIHPNPVSSNFTIETAEKIISIEIFDTAGKKLQNLNPEKTNNITNLAKGVYFLKIKTDKQEYSEKLIKK